MLSAAAPFESENLESDHQVRTFVACQLNEQKINSLLADIQMQRIEGMTNPSSKWQEKPMGTISPELKDFLRKCLKGDVTQRASVLSKKI